MECRLSGVSTNWIVNCGYFYPGLMLMERVLKDGETFISSLDKMRNVLWEFSRSDQTLPLTHSLGIMLQPFIEYCERLQLFRITMYYLD